MDEQAKTFNENQLKRVGMGEFFTPELQEKMKQGIANIIMNVSKTYEGDNLGITMHLKKDANSDRYFLDKFDASLQKDGRISTVNQTFYVSQENKYTQKEAYNLLNGRPVFKELTNKEGQPYQAWVKLNTGKLLENGSHEMKQYSSAYPFDLNKTLEQYPIKELSNEQFKAGLLDSLQRGNLQNVTFTGKDGSEQKLFVSPNIVMGSMNVYDENKQRLTTEDLLEKKLIGPELAAQLKSRVAEITPIKTAETNEKQTKKQKPENPAKRSRQKVSK